jgi:hypothetical protein
MAKKNGNGNGSNSKTVKTKKDFATLEEYYQYVCERAEIQHTKRMSRINRAMARALAQKDPRAKIQAKIAKLQQQLNLLKSEGENAQA